MALVRLIGSTVIECINRFNTIATVLTVYQLRAMCPSESVGPPP
jgi:hypothetical protein